MRVMEAVILWARFHRVTGVEVGQVPLLVVSALILITLPARQAERSVLFRAMADIAPLWVWAAAVSFALVIQVIAILTRRVWLHRWALGLAASWWFTVAVMLYFVTSIILTPMIYASIGLSAFWRVADLAVREVTRDGGVLDG